jgi:hypothetical protein
MTERDLFQFITDPSIKDVDQYIQIHLNKESTEDSISENVFKNTYIPSNISDIEDPFKGKNSVEENKFLKEMLNENQN